MAKRRKPNRTQSKRVDAKRVVDSLFDAVQPGREYESLLQVVPRSLDARTELRRAIEGIETIRKRPLICYLANVIRAVEGHTGIVEADDLPFAEMADQIAASDGTLDILIATPGGFAHQVGKFVTHVRPRFEHVSFIIPHMAMSAGTIWALSGDEIWMDARGCLGPIDPQVPGRDGRLVPAQALLTFLNQIRREGEENIKQGLAPPWTHTLLIRSIDPKELGNVLSQSVYSIEMAAGYLASFKFKSWAKHSDGRPVTPEERVLRAQQIATRLGSHDQWKLHSHGITRDVLWRELKLQIAHPETVPGLQHAIRRLWAIAYWIFDNTPVAKIFVSDGYSLFRAAQGGK